MLRLIVAFHILAIFNGLHVFAQSVVQSSGSQAVTFSTPPRELDVEATRGACAEMDLNKGPDSPFNKIPVYDQDGMGICYSYAAAQMIDYYRLKHGDRNYDLTNPVYASWVTYYKEPSLFKASSLNGGGFSESAIDALKKNGVCSNAEVRTHLSTLMKAGGGLSEPQTLYFMEMLYKNHHGLLASKNWDDTFRQISNYVPINCNEANDLKTQLKKLGYFAIAPAVVLENVFKGCKSKKVDVPGTETFQSGDDDKVKTPIVAALQKGLPANVSVCSGMFNDSHLRGLRNWSPPLHRSSNGNIKSNCGIHAVLISAQASIAGQCNYLIRNSWGSYWKPKGATACACITHEGKYKQICKASEARENVGCWFTDKDVIANTGDVNVFK